MSSLNNTSSSMDEAEKYNDSAKKASVSPLSGSDSLEHDFVADPHARDEATRIMTNPAIVERLTSYTERLSRHTTRDQPIVIDPEDFDLQLILSLFVKRASAQGIQLRSSSVAFTDVAAYGIDESVSFAPTVGNILNLPGTIIEQIKNRRTPERKILHEMAGLAHSGEMVLVLGRPGAGCSSFLKTIGGETAQFTHTSGNVLYDGIPQEDMLRDFKSDLIYNPELDNHFPHLTVDQTLRFAIACKTPELRVNNVSREKFITAMRDLLATVFGLRHTYNTKVGNDLVRGVSGGERKRVSIAEALAARGSVYCWDNATRGLDASTALEFAQAIRTSTNLLKSVAFVTAYQAGEQIYELFDKTMVLYAGRQVYYGPVTEAKKYFEDMGFQCPPRQSTAEFLTAITDPIGRFAQPGYEKRVPHTAEEFEKYWHESREYAKLTGDIAAHNAKVNVDETKRALHAAQKQEKMKHNRAKSQFTLTYLAQLRLLTIRGFQRNWGDKAYTITQVAAAIIQSLITGSLYWKTPEGTSGAFSRGGVLFFSCLYFCFMGIAEMANCFAKRPIVQKQKSYSFYHPSAEAFSSVLTDFPTKLITIIFFSIIYYFLTNLAVDAAKFFIFLLFIVVSALTMSSFFQMIAEFNQSFAGANAVAGCSILMTLMYASFMIQRPSMHPWFKWISYINPLFYAFEAIITNEFHGREMDCGSSLIPSGGQYTSISSVYKSCAFKGSVVGQSWVSGDAYMKVNFQYSYSHVWRNLGILIGFWIFFTSLKILATEYKSPMKGGGDRLMFKKGTSKDTVMIMSATKKTSDVENGNNAMFDNAPQRISTGARKVFEDLGGEDVFMWQNVDYVIDIKGEKRKLLDNVQGYVKPGTLTALMGESGAGKTTLLNVLSQRVDMGVITGDMLVNGKPIDNSFQRRTGYVQQQDLHVSESTVRESLRFSAKLRRPTSISDEEKFDYVERIIEILGMTNYADAIVGDVGYGLNVEQRKKLSIGVELVAKPSLLLFLDEPTSGLDSQSAWAIVKLMRDLANAGQAILCTIHQPSATLFEEFDRLLLLKKGGQTVYFGDIGKHSQVLLDYFERNGARQCGRSENPAEYILESIGAGATASVHEDWFQKWVSSPEYADTTETISKLIQETSQIVSQTPTEQLNSTYAAPYLVQLKTVLGRTMIQFWRSPDYIMSKLVLMIFPGLFIGFTFWALKNTLTGMQNAVFVAFLSVVTSTPLINQIQDRAYASRELFEVRESKSNTYHWSTLLLSQFITELPYCIIGSTFFFCCLYFPLRIDNSALFAGNYFLNYSILFQLYYVSFGLLVIYISPDLPSANIISALCFTFMISFCGVVQPFKLMGWWKWMYHVSPYTYFVANFVMLVLRDRKVECSSVEMAYFNPPNGQTCQEYAGNYITDNSGYLSNPDATSACGYCSYKSGDEYLKAINTNFGQLWRNFGLLWVYIFFNIFAMVLTYWLFRVKKFSFGKKKA
ncbi:hypothetical protein BABINDRAFT_158812 [Babjeviella inositovora NRRL Y-12698]|uniref:ABC transporter domain-containing protein n=1 Tax=Babjeviella inositovora NRRL Y-12698 TaxID=984486 RepID=A0A1E3QYG3_9ASCO|nr:uncharacterized protein BABINDRAFT_158812 [Babjeviella inositovora NRRL Y-12698]ODQ82162.1 hypothetical protein BABINDRAFT_158812 [Babjeviella inositovora NRRL Y-12698]